MEELFARDSDCWMWKEHSTCWSWTKTVYSVYWHEVRSCWLGIYDCLIYDICILLHLIIVGALLLCLIKYSRVNEYTDPEDIGTDGKWEPFNLFDNWPEFLYLIPASVWNLGWNLKRWFQMVRKCMFKIVENSTMVVLIARK